MLRDASDGEEVATRRVGHLLGPGLPSDVTRLIAPVILDSPDAVRGRGARSDMGKELYEPSRTPPLVAELDSAPAVILEAGGAGVLATLLNGGPNDVFRRLREPVGAARSARRTALQALAPPRLLLRVRHHLRLVCLACFGARSHPDRLPYFDVFRAAGKARHGRRSRDARRPSKRNRTRYARSCTRRSPS